MTIKFDDFILEYGISSASANDINFAANEAKLDVIMALMEYCAKEYKKSQIVQELAAPATPPPTTPTAQELVQPQTANVQNIEQSPEGYNANANVSSVQNGLTQVIETIVSNVDDLVSNFNNLFKFMLAKKRHYAAKPNQTNYKDSKKAMHRYDLELDMALLFVNTINGISKSFTTTHDVPRVISEVNKAQAEMTRRFTAANSSYNAFNMSNEQQTEVSEQAIGQKIVQVKQAIKSIDPSKFNVNMDPNSTNEVAKSIRGFYNTLMTNCNTINKELDQYNKQAA